MWLKVRFKRKENNRSVDIAQIVKGHPGMDCRDQEAMDDISKRGKSLASGIT
jgi:hypothetical protein